MKSLLGEMKLLAEKRLSYVKAKPLILRSIFIQTYIYSF